MANETYGQGEGTLSHAAGLAMTAKADLLKISAGMNEKLGGLAGQWVGEGANSFTTLQQAWTQKQNRIVGALDRFAESLGVTENINLANDQDQSVAYTKMYDRLG